MQRSAILGLFLKNAIVFKAWEIPWKQFIDITVWVMFTDISLLSNICEQIAGLPHRIRCTRVLVTDIRVFS